MLKSEVLMQLRLIEGRENDNFNHFDTLGNPRAAVIHLREARKWEFLAELLEENIEKEGDIDIHSAPEYDLPERSQPAKDLFKDDETYMPFDTDLGKGFM